MAAKLPSTPQNIPLDRKNIPLYHGISITNEDNRRYKMSKLTLIRGLPMRGRWEEVMA